MDDLISRAAALEAIEVVKNIAWSQSGKVICSKMYSQIKDIPAVDEEQEPRVMTLEEVPTDECIRDAVFCLQNPHDCLETEVEAARKMSLYALKAREPKMVDGVAEIYKDILVGNCPSCGETIVSNIKKPTKYCRFCGNGVKFE